MRAHILPVLRCAFLQVRCTKFLHESETPVDVWAWHGMQQQQRREECGRLAGDGTHNRVGEVDGSKAAPETEVLLGVTAGVTGNEK